MPSEIIVDGKIVYRNLVELNLGKEWLEQKLKEQHVKELQFMTS